MNAQSKSATNKLAADPTRMAAMTERPLLTNAATRAAISPIQALTTSRATITPAATMATRLWPASLVSSAANFRESLI